MSSRQTAGASAPHPAAPAPLPADVGIVAALPIEVGFLTDRLQNVRKYAGAGHSIIEGECAGKLVALIVAGAGRESARRGTELLLAGHQPRWVLSVGFGGALNPSYSRNQIVLATEVLDKHGKCFAIDVTVPAPNPAGSIVGERLLSPWTRSSAPRPRRLNSGGSSRSILWTWRHPPSPRSASGSCRAVPVRAGHQR